MTAWMINNAIHGEVLIQTSETASDVGSGVTELW